MPEFEPISGRYFSVDIEGSAHRIFVEEAGAGLPLLCLHTAGADSRQYRHLLNDRELIGRFRIIAFDLPYHGRSTPPDGWWLKKYRLTTAFPRGCSRPHPLSTASSRSAAPWRSPPDRPLPARRFAIAR